MLKGIWLNRKQTARVNPAMFANDLNIDNNNLTNNKVTREAMGNSSSDSEYFDRSHSEFISVDQLGQILRGQKSTDIYQSQISHSHKSNPTRKSNVKAEGYGNQG